MAARAGLRLTAHQAEDASPRNIETCLDLLGCERVDHGYHVVEDEAIMHRCRDEGVVFTCTPVSTAWVYFNDDFDNHPISQMREFGLKISLDCDDPPMFKTNPTNDMVMAHNHMGFEVEDFRQSMLNGIDGSWLDEPDKRRMRRQWAAEFDQLARAMGAHGERVSDPHGLRGAIERSIASKRCSVIHIDVDRVKHLWAPALKTFKDMHLEPAG